MKNGNLNKTEIQTLEKALGILVEYKKYVETESARCGFEPDTDYSYNCAPDARAYLFSFIQEQKESWDE